MPEAGELGIDNVLDVVTNIYGLEGRERGDEYDILCPDPEHNDTRIKNCSVNLESGFWKCLACGAKGDIIKLGVLALNEDRAHVEEMLRPSTPEAILNVARRKLAQVKTRHRKHTNLNLPGPYEPGPMTYMYERGFTPETCHRWGVRYIEHDQLEGKPKNGKPTMFNVKHTIAIPIQDEKRHMLAWCYRATPDSDSWQPKYLYTKDAALSEIWFGLHMHAKAKHIVVVEGALDAIWVDQAGIPALGLLGTSMGDRKLQYLTRFASVTLLLDRDSAGVAAIRRIGEAIGNRVPTRVARYTSRSSAKDPQEMNPVDIELSVARAIPWFNWHNSRTIG